MKAPGHPNAVLRGCGAAVVCALAGFHLWLLGQRLASAEILDAGVALRWAAATLVVVGLGALRRRGVPLLRGRKALALWLCALLLHVGAPVGADLSCAAIEDVERALPLAGAGLLALVLVATSRALTPSRHGPRGERAWAAGASAPARCRAWSLPSSPRPPPA